MCKGVLGDVYISAPGSQGDPGACFTPVLRDIIDW